MARLIHLNGAPGVGKSTVGARYAARHPGTMLVDLDVVRTWVTGWREADARLLLDVRVAGQALVRAWLRLGHDVVFPQLVAAADQLEVIARTAAEADAELVEVLLLGERDGVVDRFFRRPTDRPFDAHAAEVVRRGGGAEVLLGYHDALLTLSSTDPRVRVVRSVEGELEATVAAVAAAFG